MAKEDFDEVTMVAYKRSHKVPQRRLSKNDHVGFYFKQIPMVVTTWEVPTKYYFWSWSDRSWFWIWAKASGKENWKTKMPIEGEGGINGRSTSPRSKEDG